MSLYRPTTNNQTSAPLGAFRADRGPNHIPRYHQGHDYPVPSGTPVYSSGDGVVRIVTNTGRTSGYGLYVRVDYGTVEVITAHMSAVHVSRGDHVPAGTLLGYSGGVKGAFGAGASQGPHVHCEVYVNGALADPQQVLDPRSTISLAGDTRTQISEPNPGDDTMSAADVAELKTYINDTLEKAVVARVNQLLLGAAQYRVIQCTDTPDGAYKDKAEIGQLAAVAPGSFVAFPSFDYYALAVQRGLVTERVTGLPWNEYTFWRDTLYLAPEGNDEKSLAALARLPKATVAELVSALTN